MVGGYQPLGGSSEQNSSRLSGFFRELSGQSPNVAAWPKAEEVSVGLFGRKTFRIGPVRITASKSGLSESIGGRRGRIGINSRGRRRASFNFGKGFRWTR